MKKVISALTALIMTYTIILGIFPVSAEETQSAQPTVESDISVEGTNSFGNLLTDCLDGKMDEQEENNGCNVFSAEVTDNEATVSFETTESCTLLVAVYDEAGEQMLASGSAEVTSEETEKTVTIETDSMPQYFYLRAFLVNTVTLRPICTAYESPNYTQEMQEFFAKTVDDFDSEKVLNLDEDKSNNFAVYADGTKVIQSDGTVNKVTKTDETNGIYIIENADSTFTLLSAGDIFALEQPDGNVLIVKVGTIEVNGTTVTISEQDTSMEEVFDYVKIDESQGTGEVTVDDSELEDGVTYEGMVDDTVEAQTYSTRSAYGSDYAYMPTGPEIQATEIDAGISSSLSFKIADKKIGSDDNNVTVSGDIELKLKGSVKVYISLSYLYLEFRLDYTAKISASLSGSVKKSGVSLGFVELAPVPGVFVRFKPAVVFEVSGKFEISGTLSSTLGFATGSDIKYKSLSSSPSFETEVKAEVTFFVGLSLEPELVVLDNRIAYAKMTAEIGAEVKAEMTIYEELSSSSIHTCQKCIDGEVIGKINLSAEAKLLDMDRFKFGFDLFDFSIKLFDFYYSFDHQQGGFTSCPYKSYKVSVLVNDKDGNPVSGATLTNGLSESVYGTTDENGRFEMWCSNGKWNIVASKDGLKDSREITVADNSKIVKLILGRGFSGSGGSGGSDDNDNPTISAENQRLSLGGYHSGYIDDNGSLYMWGHNGYGQLGNGTTTDSLTPIKIMDNVKAVSLGHYNSAAITEDGSLYMWGENGNGQLGNGTTEDSWVPVKIMDNVKAVSLGDVCSAAITEDGSLYIWGCNYHGQFGNGTRDGSWIPIKIMDNVKAVSLGYFHSGAITEDGSLYMWGYNGCGSLGNGTTGDSCVPVKIMDVKSVSLGYHSGAITEDGSLYMWGHNIDGELGNGTTTDSSTPIKIMDNVKAVSLGVEHTAAITEDGSLYMWGYNCIGQLGNGTTNDSSTPIKIMYNVKSVSLGGVHSAAITEDGSLYMWGDNDYGQLGNGRCGLYENSLVPIKIDIPSSTATVSAQSYSLTKQYTYLSDEPALQTKNFTDLLPNETYNFYMIKSSDNYPLEEDNLLYVSQGVSDENGNLTVSYIPKAEYADAEIFIKGMTRTDLSGAQVKVPDILCNGEEQFAQPEVILDGVTLSFGDDYDIERDYSAVIPGEYELIISGINDYAGEVSAVYNVYCEHSFESGKCTICGSLETDKGDVNGDGVTGIADIVALQKYLVKLKTDVSANADVNVDGVVNVFDLIILKRMVIYA